MVPALLNLIIIELLWIREDNVIIKPATNILIINSYGLIISTKIIPVLLKIKELMVTPFTILVKRARKCQNPLTVFKVLLKDIIKALHFKVLRTPAEIQKLLPAQYYDYLFLFEGDVAVELPPHRFSIDYICTLEKGENR